MTIEEKAKAYDEAIKRLEDIKSGKCETTFMFTEGLFEHIFPELKESEDERIRKELLNAFQESEDSLYMVLTPHRRESFIAWLEKQGKPIDKIVKRAMNEKQRVLLTETNGDANIDWDTRSLQDVKLLLEYGLGYIKKLEKQGEQKPTEEYNITGIGSKNAQGKLGKMIKNLKPINEVLEQKPVWSEEDDKFFKAIIRDIENIKYISEDAKKDRITWLKFFKDRVQPQPNQEWSEEDEKILKAIHNSVDVECLSKNGLDYIVMVDWFKSLKDRVQPQNKWKESLATADLENSLCDIQDGFSDTSYEYRILGEAIEFIRCTESKPQWKPSDEQMEALKEACREHYDPKGALYSLCEDLVAL